MRCAERKRTEKARIAFVALALCAPAAACAGSSQAAGRSVRSPVEQSSTTVPVVFERPLGASLDVGIGRLAPPVRADIPRVPGVAALQPIDGSGNVMRLSACVPGVRPVVRLARFLAAPAGRGTPLVWAVICNGVQLPDRHGPAATGPGAPRVAARRGELGVWIVIVDATSGHAFEETGFGPPLSAAQLG